jgi:putative transposase
MARKRKPQQQVFEFPQWGGARKGSGPKRAEQLGGVRHRARDVKAGRNPLHVTFRLRRGLPSLRTHAAHRVLLDALAAGSGRFGFRVVHYSAQSNHVHLLCEAESKRALALGMNALMTRIARRLNRLWEREGSVFMGRYHCRALSTPLECHRALAYVFGNGARHGVHHVDGIDPFSSAASFEGWDPPLVCCAPPEWAITLPKAKTWLLREGWLIHGRLPREMGRSLGSINASRFECTKGRRREDAPPASEGLPRALRKRGRPPTRLRG